jgi:3-phenylpropionate/trans-cinnamate dioxygenase ferredoxin subunit
MLILIVRKEEQLLAIDNACTHQGALLDRGFVNIAHRTVTCSAHGSMFSLDDGHVMRPPAARPVQTYEIKIDDDGVFVRPASSQP